MQEIKNVYVDVYCIRDGMVHIFFVQGQGTRRKIIHFVCTHKIFAGCLGGERDGDGIEVKVGCYSEKCGDEKGSTERECVDYHRVSKYNDGW